MLLRPMHLRSTPAFCQSKCRRARMSWHILLLLKISSRSSRTIKTRHLHHFHFDLNQAQLFQISCGKVESFDRDKCKSSSKSSASKKKMSNRTHNEELSFV